LFRVPKEKPVSEDNLAMLVVMCVAVGVIAAWKFFWWLDRRAEQIVREQRGQREQEHDKQWREYQVRLLNDALRDDSISTWM
jgi:hypothetical protein